MWCIEPNTSTEMWHIMSHSITSGVEFEFTQKNTVSSANSIFSLEWSSSSLERRAIFVKENSKTIFKASCYDWAVSVTATKQTQMSKRSISWCEQTLIDFYNNLSRVKNVFNVRTIIRIHSWSLERFYYPVLHKCYTCRTLTQSRFPSGSTSSLIQRHRMLNV